jgi:hypothetical protein
MDKQMNLKKENEQYINKKNVQQINVAYDSIVKTIEIIQENTAHELSKQRSEVWAALDKRLEDIK